MAKERLERKPRRAVAVDPAARAELVARGEAVDRALEPEAKRGRPKATVKRAQTTLYLDPDVRRRLVSYCANESARLGKVRAKEAEISTVANDAIREFLDRRGV